MSIGGTKLPRSVKKMVICTCASSFDVFPTAPDFSLNQAQPRDGPSVDHASRPVRLMATSVSLRYFSSFPVTLTIESVLTSTSINESL